MIILGGFPHKKDWSFPVKYGHIGMLQHLRHYATPQIKNVTCIKYPLNALEQVGNKHPFRGRENCQSSTSNPLSCSIQTRQAAISFIFPSISEFFACSDGKKKKVFWHVCSVGRGLHSSEYLSELTLMFAEVSETNCSYLSSGGKPIWKTQIVSGKQFLAQDDLQEDNKESTQCATQTAHLARLQ